MKKSIYHLIPADFSFHSIWQPVDDLEDSDMEVVPFQGNELHMENIYLVASDFKFSDDSKYEGYIRFSWGEPIEMAVAIDSKDFFSFAIAKTVETEERHIEFAKKFKKEKDDVFPLKYQTKIKIYLQGGVY